MHKLDRETVSAPLCLENYDYQSQSWDNLQRECKEQVRNALVQMQGIPDVSTQDANEYGVRCAYCEGAIHHAGHIEHFCRKNCEHYPELTFAWNNLFLACGSYDHCGHYKDGKQVNGYAPDDLIKPDIDDPDHYLYFHSDGVVRVRDRLSDQNQKRRAEETIRVFGLRDPALVAARAKAVSPYKTSSELEEILSWPEAMLKEYLDREIENTKWHPYATTIKHFLQAM